MTSPLTPRRQELDALEEEDAPAPEPIEAETT